MGYMKLKDFFTSSLLPAGSTFETRVLNATEVLSPLDEIFIIKEFLSKVHPKLPEYVKNSKRSLSLVCMFASFSCNDQLNK